jgi:hypothetical protein
MLVYQQNTPLPLDIREGVGGWVKINLFAFPVKQVKQYKGKATKN